MQRKERLFKFGLIMVPIVFFALLEVVLQILNYGGNRNLFLEKTINGKPYYAINPEVTRRYFHTIPIRASVSQDVFEKEKPVGTYRIFCFGESSTLGYPYMYQGAFPNMLKDRLETLWPDKNFEVINLGVTAVNSYTVLDFVREAVSYQPDAFLVYSGHNEFYGALGIGSVEQLGSKRAVITTYLRLQKWRTFLLLRDVLFSLKSFLTSAGSEWRGTTVMEGMVKNKEISFESAEYVAARENFRSNLVEIAELAREHRVDLLFGTLISNLSGMKPFVSVFSSATAQELRQQWEELFLAGEEKLAAKAYDDALASFQRCLEIDPLPARLHFAVAKCYEARKEYGKASEHYVFARDYDALRFRAPSQFNDIIRQVGEEHRVPVAESEQVVSEQSTNGIVGNGLVLEHVHLSVDGYLLLAKSFLLTMAENGFIAPKDQWPWQRNKSDDAYREMAAVTDFDSVSAFIRVRILTNSWPFRESNAGVSQFNATTELERLAESFLAQEITWEQAHVRLAEQYESAGNSLKAAREYRALLKVTPYNASPYLRLGRILLGLGREDEAASAFAKSLKIERSFIASYGLGYVHLKRGRFAEAVRNLRQALEVAGGATREALLETRHLLAASLAGLGNYAEAKQEAEAILNVQSDHEPTRDLLKKIESANTSRGN